MNWYRIELNPDGSVSTCAVVENREGGDGRSVFYVQADSEAEACLWAATLYDRRQSQKAGVKKRAAEKAQASGQCKRCHHRPAKEGRLRCEYCLKLLARNKARWERGETADRVRLSPAQKAEAVARAREKKALHKKLRPPIVTVRKKRAYRGPKHAMLAGIRERLLTLSSQAFEGWLVSKCLEARSAVLTAQSAANPPPKKPVAGG